MLTTLSNHLLGLPFRVPVDPYEDGVPDYYEKVTCPMDLQTMRLRLERGKYQSMEEFYQDLELIISNARLYHHRDDNFIAITKKFETLCTKLRRQLDPASHKRRGPVARKEQRNVK